MVKALLFVESRPKSPEHLDKYHEWQDEVHLPEMLTIDGFVSARRWKPEGGDTFITLYELDTDVETAAANLKAAFATGKLSKTVGVETDPPAIRRYLSLIGEFSG